MRSGRVLAIDAGTSAVRAVVVDGAGRPLAERRRATPPHSPAPGHVEFDAGALADAALRVAGDALGDAGPVDAVGISSQRASTVLWERRSGRPVAPALGWQDLRTAPRCAELAREGLALLPNQSATKLAHLLDGADAGRHRDLCFGTVDAWLAFRLSEGACHATDAGNASATGLVRAGGWSAEVCEALGIPLAVLPRIVDSVGVLGAASALPGAPPLAGLLGDQQAALLGQGCVAPGAAKLTVGSGAMLDVRTAERAPRAGARGTFPIVAWRVGGRDAWALEAIVLAAGTHLEWLRDGLGLLRDVADVDRVAGGAEGESGVVFVPALQGLGTPWWDHGARGAFFGLTRGTTAAQMVRAVVEGVAQRCADLLEAAEADAGLRIGRLRVDGGLTASAVFLRTLADACGRPLETAPTREATAWGAAFAAGVATGLWPGLEAAASLGGPRRRVEPRGALARERWREAVARARSSRPS